MYAEVPIWLLNLFDLGGPVNLWTVFGGLISLRKVRYERALYPSPSLSGLRVLYSLVTKSDILSKAILIDLESCGGAIWKLCLYAQKGLNCHLEMLQYIAGSSLCSSGNLRFTLWTKTAFLYCESFHRFLKIAWNGPYIYNILLWTHIYEQIFSDEYHFFIFL